MCLRNHNFFFKPSLLNNIKRIVIIRKMYVGLALLIRRKVVSLVFLGLGAECSTSWDEPQLITLTVTKAYSKVPQTFLRIHYLECTVNIVSLNDKVCIIL